MRSLVDRTFRYRVERRERTIFEVHYRCPVDRAHLICMPVPYSRAHFTGVATPLPKDGCAETCNENVRGDVLHENLHTGGICYRKMDMLDVERRNVIRAAAARG